MRLSRYIFSFIVLLLSLNASTAQEGDIASGEALFGAQCATCHAKNMKTNATGPALGGVQERWADYPEEDLYAWIRNSQKLIAEGHPRAVQVWNEWKPTVMNSFTALTDDEIANMLVYIDAVYKGEYPKVAAVVGTDGAGDNVVKEGINKPLFIALFVILALLAVVLARIISNLNYLAEVKEGNDKAKRRTLVDVLTSRGVIGFVIFALVVLGGYTTVNNAIELGRQQGYEPEQPIKFSHATHSGLHKIECQYCHDGARRSKHSVIPATNTCMNCHRAIKVGSKYGTQELTKIYASIGYDPSTDKYIENYDNLSQEEVKAIYTQWIADNYLDANKENPKALEKIGEVQEQQWDNIFTSLTNDIKPKVQGPIEWIRIHNMPDHVYFNHAQHVTVGKQECQTCHGPIQEMEVVYQYSPLSMGWCINCHRQTEVDFANNDYYDSYKKYHEEMQKGDREAVTVEDVGGLGCQKCHY
ncbi:MAG: cytochrome c3 family protein [Bacteroidota bacterium]